MNRRIGTPEGAVISKPFVIEEGARDKRVGRVVHWEGMNYFYKEVERERHFMWSMNSWGIQQYIADQLEKLGVEAIVLDVMDEGLYLAPLSALKTARSVDKGHGLQAFIHESEFAEFTWPVGRCGATIVFGDNEATFHCQLDKGHEGKHSELGDMGDEGGKYVLTWSGDARERE
jgi:hypothetical protein